MSAVTLQQFRSRPPKHARAQMIQALAKSDWGDLESRLEEAVRRDGPFGNTVNAGWPTSHGLYDSVESLIFGDAHTSPVESAVLAHLEGGVPDPIRHHTQAALEALTRAADAVAELRAALAAIDKVSSL